MAHRRHRTINRARKKFRHIAAAVAGAAILSGAMLPGISPATVQAASAPEGGNSPPVTTEQSVNTAGHPAMQDGNKLPAGKQAHDKAPSNYREVLDIKATAYAPGPHDNDQWGDKTFLGTQIRPGVIAVDPSVIPLGSRVYIQYPDGHGQYAVAEDTGGAIKGNRIDVATTSVAKAKDFGIQHVKVFILNKKA